MDGMKFSNVNTLEGMKPRRLDIISKIKDENSTRVYVQFHPPSSFINYTNLLGLHTFYININGCRFHPTTQPFA